MTPRCQESPTVVGIPRRAPLGLIIWNHVTGHLEPQGRLGGRDVWLSLLPPCVVPAVVGMEGRTGTGWGVGAAARPTHSAWLLTRVLRFFMHHSFARMVSFAQKAPPALLSSVHPAHYTSALTDSPDPSGPFSVTVLSSLLLDIISLSFPDACPCWRAAYFVLGLPGSTARSVLSHSCH